MSELEERVTQLEIRHTYSEELVQTLSELVRDQQQAIDGLKQQMTKMLQQQDGDHVDEPPPHY